MRPITVALLSATLVLAACGSDDGADPAPGPGAIDPAAGGPATSGPAGETSLPGPDIDPDAPPSSAPGGPTPLVAGLWDASGDGAPASDYVDIAADGLWTRYAVPDVPGNCFEVAGPYTLTLELPEADGYSLSSEDRGITLAVEGDVLTYTDAEGDVETWRRTDNAATLATLNLAGPTALLCG